MSARPLLCLPTLVAIVSASCTEPKELERAIEAGSTARDSTERSRLAASGRFLVTPSTSLLDSTPEQLVAALDIPDDMDPVAEIERPEGAAGLHLTGYGVIAPRKGGSFVVLSTGRSTNDQDLQATAEPGSDFPPAGAAGDVVTLRIELQVPPEATRLSFDYNFLSAESPEYVHTSFNDSFTARVTDSLDPNPRVIATASVNSAVFHPGSLTKIGQTPYLLYADNALGLDTVFTGEQMDAGTTEFQKVSVPIKSTGQIVLEFSIRDVGDGIVDSMVILDNLAFPTVEVVEPTVSELDALDNMVDEQGRVYLDPEKLVGKGRPVHSVAADGVTQVLLRTQVPGPGTGTFTLQPDSDGKLNPLQEALTWSSNAVAEAVQAGPDGAWYVFALYQSPANFSLVGGADPTKERTVALSLSYTPSAGTANDPFVQPFTIGIVRPPLVVVHDLWLDCIDWDDLFKNSEALHPFSMTCADYTTTSSKGLKYNHENGEDSEEGEGTPGRGTVYEHIKQALDTLHATGAAGTRADVIGHGMGGLLARMHIDASLRRDNFYEGDIHRLITMNTGHLGSRLAQELVAFRNELKLNKSTTWTQIKKTLGNQGIAFDNIDDNLALDEMTPESDTLKSMGSNPDAQNKTYHHALVSTGGRSVLRDPARNSLRTSIKTLTFQMEYNHCLTRDESSTEKYKLIWGNESKIFCNDDPKEDHDLAFSTSWEQRGGLGDTQATTYLNSAMSFANHWKAPGDDARVNDLIELLNSDVSSANTPFAKSMPLYNDVPKYNSCPIVCPTQLLPPPSQSLQGNIDIVLPISGTTVAPGTDILVAIQPSGAQPDAVLVLSPDTSLVLQAPSQKGPLHIPATAVGPITLEAIAFYHGGNVSVSQPITLHVEPTATLTSIEVLNGDAYLPRPGRSRQLTVLGTYSDGVRRNITSGLGTKYVISSLSQVATVTDSGLVTATGPGNATLAVRHGIRITSINIKVGAARCGDGVIDAGEECDDGNVIDGDGCSSTCIVQNAAPVAVCESPTACTDPGACSAAVALGADSTDPDGAPLSITQSPAGPYGVGQHAVTVSVSDGTLEDQCVSQLEVLDCEAPALSCPADFTTQCTGGGGADVDPPAASATDNCGVATVNAPAPGPLPLGTSELTYTASDASGNGATCTTKVTVEDTIEPSITCPAPATAECTANGHAPVDPGVASAIDTCSTATVIHPGTGPYPLGTTAVTYTATDPSGNQNTCQTTVTVQDTTAPSVTCPAPAVAECTGNGQAVVDPAAATATDACTTASVTDPGPASYPLGTTPVTYAATDPAGNQSTCQTTVTVQDTTAPSVACPAPTVAECTGNGQATIDPGDAAATDACTTASVTDPGPGSYPLGTTPVTYTATDTSGNQGSCQTTVTVQDTAAPSITCPAPMVAECTGNGQAVVDPPAATATDACAAVAAVDPGPASYPLGTTPVTYTAVDGAGHPASCSTSVTVQDTLAPSITCPAPVIAECAGPSGAFVQPGQATSSDVCTAVTVTGPSAGTYPPGTTVVTYTAQDATGHASSCDSSIQVVDTTAPQVSVTPPDQLWPADHKYRTISLDDCNIVVEDACGGGPLPPSTYQAAITCVSSDEPDNAPGGADGHTVNDIVIVNSTTVKVRAERHGALDGRVYNIRFRVQDAAGNLRDGVCPVIVEQEDCKKDPDDPHDPEEKPKCPPVDSGVAHQVCL